MTFAEEFKNFDKTSKTSKFSQEFAPTATSGDIATPPPPKTFWQKAGDTIKGVAKSAVAMAPGMMTNPTGTLLNTQTGKDFTTGMAKTIPGAVKGMFGLVEKGMEATGATPPGQSISSLTSPAYKKTEEAITTPTNTSQKSGYLAGELAQFLMPVPGLSKVKAGGLLARVAAEGIEAGVKTSIQKGEVGSDAKTNTLIAMAFPTLGATYKAVAPELAPSVKALGQKIQSVVIKPNAKDFEKGFKLENIQKYGLGGTLKQSMEKTETKLNEYWGKVKSALESSKSKGGEVDLNDAYLKTVENLQKKSSKNFGDLGSINRVKEKLASEIDDVSNKTGIVDILEAQNVKQGAGTKGAWVFGSADPDASATEIVYDEFYHNLKTAIEDTARKTGNKGIEEANKAMSELIPIKSALVRRMPVSERNQILGLTDKMNLLGAMFNPKALALYGVDKLLKSGRFAEFLVKASESMKNAGSKTGVVSSRIFGESKPPTPPTPPTSFEPAGYLPEPAIRMPARTPRLSSQDSGIIKNAPPPTQLPQEIRPGQKSLPPPRATYVPDSTNYNAQKIIEGKWTPVKSKRK